MYSELICPDEPAGDFRYPKSALARATTSLQGTRVAQDAVQKLVQYTRIHSGQHSVPVRFRTPAHVCFIAAIMRLYIDEHWLGEYRRLAQRPVVVYNFRDVV